jgi:hypothetical protein
MHLAWPSGALAYQNCQMHTTKIPPKHTTKSHRNTDQIISTSDPNIHEYPLYCKLLYNHTNTHSALIKRTQDTGWNNVQAAGSGASRASYKAAPIAAAAAWRMPPAPSSPGTHLALTASMSSTTNRHCWKRLAGMQDAGHTQKSFYHP